MFTGVAVVTLLVAFVFFGCMSRNEAAEMHKINKKNAHLDEQEAQRDAAK